MGSSGPACCSDITNNFAFFDVFVCVHVSREFFKVCIQCFVGVVVLNHHHIAITVHLMAKKYDAITDCGGGGLSSAVGEMAQDLGCRVDLEKVPLKYRGLSYTEIWISESQERMILSVPIRL